MISPHPATLEVVTVAFSEKGMVTSTLVALQGTGGGAPAISQSSHHLSTAGRLWQPWTKKTWKIWEYKSSGGSNAWKHIIYAS